MSTHLLAGNQLFDLLLAELLNHVPELWKLYLVEYLEADAVSNLITLFQVESEQIHYFEDVVLYDETVLAALNDLNSNILEHV